MISPTFKNLNLETLQILLEPLSRDWPELVTETLMAIEEGLDARCAGEVLAQGFREQLKPESMLTNSDPKLGRHP